MKIINMSVVIGKKRYRTETATKLAGNDYWDGNNFERGGRNRWLFRTPNGAYFIQIQTLWQGEQHSIRPITKEEAIEEYESLQEQYVEFEDAFPGMVAEDA